MKKKITILIITFLIILGTTNAATLTQKIGSGFIRALVQAGEQITLKFMNNGTANFNNWVEETSTGVLDGIDATNTQISFTMPSSDVTIKADYTGESSAEEELPLLADVVSVGDYITYVPSSTSYTVSATASGYTSDQTYNPSEVTSWRVFSNDGTNVEIISDDIVGYLSLCKDDAYIRAIQILQDLCGAYVNSIYAINGRCFGYSEEGLTSDEIENYKEIDTAKYPLERGVSGFPYSDSQYLNDFNILKENENLLNDKVFWIASRNVDVDVDDDNTYWELRNFSYRISDGLDSSIIWSLTGGSSSRSGVCPIINLRPDLQIVGGDGSESEPWQILAAYSPVTITYNSNGGNGVVENQEVDRYVAITLPNNEFEKDGYVFMGWSTNSSTLEVEYGEGDVIIPEENMTLYAIWLEENTLLTDMVDVGDYVRYLPNVSTYTISASVSGNTESQLYTPINTTLWQVFSNDSENVEIMNYDEIGEVLLYSSKGYINAVQILQNLANAYVNNFAISARSLGYSENGLTASEIENYKKINTSIYPLEVGVSGFPYEDTQYIYDENVIANNKALRRFVTDSIIVASRRVFSYSDGVSYGIRFMSPENGEVNSYATLSGNGSYSSLGKPVGGIFRAIVKLSSEVIITGGMGTQNNPWEITIIPKS